MKAYDLDMPLLMRLAPFVVLTLCTVAPPAIILTSGGPTFLILPLLGVLGWNWWVVMTLAYRIVLHEDGTVEWVALGRSVRVRPEEIREIRPDRSGGIGFFTAIHTAGKVRFVNQITGFHDVIAHIKDRNPTVVLRGC